MCYVCIVVEVAQNLVLDIANAEKQCERWIGMETAMLVVLLQCRGERIISVRLNLMGGYK
jgi:hypothetical protein